MKGDSKGKIKVYTKGPQRLEERGDADNKCGLKPPCEGSTQGRKRMGNIEEEAGGGGKSCRVNRPWGGRSLKSDQGIRKGENPLGGRT